MKKILSIICLLFVHLSASAQTNYHDKVWLQGELMLYRTEFNGANFPINGISKYWGHVYVDIGQSGICKADGTPLLVCNGYNLFDTSLNYIEDGDTLIPKLLYEYYDGFTAYDQSSIILPFNNEKYIVVTPTASDKEFVTYWANPSSTRALFDLLLYHEVDMHANGGKGKVVKKAVPLLQDVMLSKTQMMACRHADGKSWWLLKQASDTNMIYKFLFTQDSIYGPFIQSFPEPHFTKWDIGGQAMFSQDGTQYATTVQGFGKFFIADFDRCSGLLSRPRTIDVPIRSTENPFDTSEKDVSTCGLAFSPNGRFLYVNGFYTIQQCDLLDNNPNTRWTQLSGPDTTFRVFQRYSNIYPGPDGRLYISRSDGIGGTMSVINQPDRKGLASEFCRQCLRFPYVFFQGQWRTIGVTTPPCMPNYHLGAAANPCYPAGVKAPLPKEYTFSLFPNPASQSLRVNYSLPGRLELYDMRGQRVKVIALMPRKGSVQVDVSALSAGVYLAKYLVEGQVLETRKLSVVQE
ncbi:MAG: T9SS type A sorting domain-containing protein [Bacteroidetes bacterium]|nr:T9SS type A sorting domain-containing protein [Bacteroidota bacterium]